MSVEKTIAARKSDENTVSVRQDKGIMDKNKVKDTGDASSTSSDSVRTDNDADSDPLDFDASLENAAPGTIVESGGIKMVILPTQNASVDELKNVRSTTSPESSLESLTFSELSSHFPTPATRGNSASQGNSSVASTKSRTSKTSSRALKSKASSTPPTLDSVPVREYQPGDRVTIWHRVEKRKVAGNAAPLFKNLESYIKSHLDREVYNGQDYELGLATRRKRSRSRVVREPKSNSNHVAIWNKKERRKVAGNAAPLLKNIESYLARRPDCEVYKGQDLEDSDMDGSSVKVVKRRAVKTGHSKCDRPDLSLPTLLDQEPWPPTYIYESEDFNFGNDLDFSSLQLISGNEEKETFNIEAFINTMISRREVASPRFGELDDVEKVTVAMDVGGFSPVHMVKT